MELIIELSIPLYYCKDGSQDILDRLDHSREVAAWALQSNLRLANNELSVENKKILSKVLNPGHRLIPNN